MFAGIETMPGKHAPEPVMLEESPKKSLLKILILVVMAVVILLVLGLGLRLFVLKLNDSSQPHVSVLATSKTSPLALEANPVLTPTQSTTSPVTQPPAGSNVPLPQLAQPVPPSPLPIVSEGKDTDGDKLTDVEEATYGTDLRNPDTDGDGYPDGSEVRSLFDPSKKGAKLADAKYMSRLFEKDMGLPNFSLLAPKPWSLVLLPTNLIRAALTTGSVTATRFIFEWESNIERMPIDAWLAVRTGVVAATMHPIQTKNSLEGRQTSDGLTTYLPLSDGVLIVRYDLNDDTAYDYRTSYELVIQSLTETKQ